MEHVTDEALRKEAEERNYTARAMAGASAGPSRPLGVLDRARQGGEGCSTTSLSQRAWARAHTKANDAARHERLAEALTPEIEKTLFCLQECIALGLIDAAFIHEALVRTRHYGAADIG